MTVVQKQVFGLGANVSRDAEENTDAVFPTPKPLLLTYDSDSPFEVVIQFMGIDEPLHLERSSLLSGRFIPQQLGSVRVCPAEGEGLPEGMTFLGRVSGERADVAFIPTDELSDFLSDTQRLVPIGKESMNIDSELERLLGGNDV